MAYLENSDISAGPYKGQQASSSDSSIMKNINLYRGEVNANLKLVSLDGPDGLDITLAVCYEPAEEQFFRSNRLRSSGVAGTGMVLPLAQIFVRNRQLRETYQSEYCISGEGGEFPLYRKGLNGHCVEFQSIEHPFWIFRKFHEHWEITRDDGTVWVYGGTQDSREINVYWENWTGPCKSSGGEGCIVGWYLSEVRNRYGEAVKFLYENVKRPFGDSEYTSEIHLKQIISPFGQRVDLNYLEKRDNEYVLPYGLEDGSCQLLCERHYLDTLDVRAESGELLYSQKLNYELCLTGKGKAIRLLTEISQVTPEGEVLPPLRVRWNTQGDFPGRITDLEYPRGGALRFTYEGMSAENFDPETFLEIEEGWECHAVNGGDFTAVLLTKESDNSARLILYSWDMTWQFYEDTGLKAQAVREASLFLGNGIAAVRYRNPLDNSYRIRIVKRIPVKRYEWEGCDIQLTGTLCPGVACGDDFVAVQYTDCNALRICQFHYLDNTWHHYELPVDIMQHQIIGAGNGCVFGAYGNDHGESVRIAAFYSDEEHRWRQGGVMDVPAQVAWKSEDALPVWSISGALASACFIGETSETVEGTLIAVSWDGEYQFTGRTIEKISQTKAGGNPIYFSVARDHMIGFANTAIRYTPSGFVKGELFAVSDRCEYAYAYGSDLILGTEKSKDGTQRFEAKRFDPVSGVWVSEGAPYAEQINSEDKICCPLITLDYALLGRNVFLRDTETDIWNQIGTIPDEAEFASARLDPSGSYLIYNTAPSGVARFASLLSGEMEEAVEMQGSIGSEGKAYEAGMDSFFLWPADRQIKGLNFYSLFRKEYRETSPVVTCVKSILLDSGYDKQRVFFDYDRKKARLENGRLAMGEASVRPAAEDGSFGATVYHYYNGGAPSWMDYPETDQYCNAADFYTHFSGQLAGTESYDGNGGKITESKNEMKAFDSHGFCIMQTRMIKKDYVKRFVPGKGAGHDLQDQICSVVEYEYEPVYQRRCKVRNRFLDKAGKEISVVQHIQYAFENNPGMKEANLLNDIALICEESETECAIIQKSRYEYEKNENGYYYQSGQYKMGRKEGEWYLEKKTEMVDGTCRALCTVDERGLPAATLYDKNGRYPVAVINNARPREVLYCGFEYYENTDGIEVSGKPCNSYITSDQSFSGDGSLCLPAGKELTMKVGVRENGLRVRFSMKSEAAVRMVVDFGQGDISERQFAPDEAWSVRRELFYSRLDTGRASITVKGESEIWLDDVYITPVHASGEASVYSGPRMLQTALHRNDSPGIFTYFDRYDVPCITAGEDGRLIEFTDTVYSGDDSPDEKYTIQPSSYTAWYDARQGYQKSELLYPQGAGWKFRDAGNFALVFSELSSDCGREMSVHIGETSLTAKKDSWELRNSGVAREIKREKGTFYVLLKMGKRCCFYSDGRKLLSFLMESETAGLYLADGQDIRYLGYIPEPFVALSCADHSGRVIQDQIVTENGIRIVHTVYDEAGVQLARTAQVEVPEAFWGYRPEFVTSYDRDTGKTDGEINGLFEEAGGYPCTAFHMSKCAEPKLKEMAQSGEKFAFGNGLTIRSDICSVGGFSSVVKDGVCSGDILYDPDGVATLNIRDGRGPVMSGRLSPDGSVREITAWDQDARGNKTRIYYPEYFAESRDAKAYVTEIAYDSLGNIARRKDPNTEEVLTVFDRYGNLRFLRQDLSGIYVYHLYDRYGRKTEMGYVEGEWNDQRLREKADTENERPEGGVPVRNFYYDEMPEKGEASDQIGKLTRVVTVTDGETVDEKYEYDCYGRQVRYILMTEERREECITAYDAAGNVISRSTGGNADGMLEYRYGSGRELQRVLYQGKEIYECGYTPQGKLARESFGSAMQCRYSYDTAGYLTEIEGTYFHQKLRYSEGKEQRKGGQITGIETKFYFGGEGQAPESAVIDVFYDPLGRVSKVKRNGEESYSSSYDRNGNQSGDGLTYISGTDKLQSAKGESFAYEGYGAVSSIQGRAEFLYEPVTQNVKRFLADGQCTTYRLGAEMCGFQNGNGLTLSVQSEDGRTFYERTESGQTVMLVYGANGVFAQIVDGKVYYLIKDYRSSVLGIADNSGLLAAYDYDLFGKPCRSWESQTLPEGLIPLRFAGARMEGAGIYRFSRRFYDAHTGRFLSIDPESQYPNPYVYGGCDWINYFDPDGAFNVAGFLASFFTGVVLLAVGVAVTVATAGLGGALGTVLSVAAAGLIGAGISSCIYSVTSAINDDFTWGAWGIQLGAGAVFGMVSAGIGAAMPASMGVAGSVIYDGVSGMIVGAADGVVTNGILNIYNGKAFLDNAVINGTLGAVMGGVLGAVTGMSTAARNAKNMVRTSGEGSPQMVLGNNTKGCCGSHSVMGIRKIGPSPEVKGAHLTYRQVAGGVDRTKAGVQRFDFDTGYEGLRSVNVTENVYQKIDGAINALGGGQVPYGRYGMISNSCTGYVIKLSANAGIYQPLWARSPVMMDIWGRLTGAFQH